MAIIGWISLAIVIGAVIYLVISGFGTYKSMKPKIDHLQAVSERLQAEQRAIQSETEKLKATQQHIQQDIEVKKEAVMFTVNEAKRTPESIKQLGTALNIMRENIKLKLPMPKSKKKAETV